MASLTPYEQGRQDQAARTVDTDRTEDREYVRGLGDQRRNDVDAELAGEPSPWRDNGPYASVDEARDQIRRISYGIPGATDELIAGMSIAEALLLAGLTDDNTTEYECQVRDDLGRQLDPATAQVIAGWIIRAHLAGIAGTARRTPA